MKASLIALVVGVALLAGGFPCRAEVSDTYLEDPKEIERLSNLALELARSNRMEDAILVWRSLRDKVQGATRADVELNLAVAHRKLGNLPAAWFYLSQYLQVRPDDAKAQRLLVSMGTKLKKTHAQVHFTCDSDSVHLEMDEGAARTDWPCPLTWWFTPGEYRVAAVMGSIVVIVPVVVSPQRQDVAITVPALAEQRPKEEPGVPDVTTPEVLPVAGGAPDGAVDGTGQGASVTRQQGQSGSSTLAVVTTVVGAGLLCGAGALHYAAAGEEESLAEKYPSTGVDYATFLGNKKSYEAGYDDTVEPMLMSAYALYGVGAAALLGGLAWLIWGDSDEAPVVTGFPLPEGGWVLGVNWVR